jgi:hypothetical protein
MPRGVAYRLGVCFDRRRGDHHANAIDVDDPRDVLLLTGWSIGIGLPE